VLEVQLAYVKICLASKRNCQE